MRRLQVAAISRATWSRGFSHQSFGRDVLVLSGGTVGAQLIGLAAGPMLTRLYSPANFGDFALFVAVSGLVATVVTLRYETAILLPPDDQQGKSLVVLSLALAVCLGAIVVILFAILPTPILASVGLEGLGGWLALSGLAGTIAAVFAVGGAWLNRECQYLLMAAAKLSQGGAAALLAIGFGLLGFQSGLLVAQLLAGLVGVGLLARPVIKGVRAGLRVPLRSVARAYSASPKFLLPAAVLDATTLALPVFLIAALFSVKTAGQYGLAWRVLMVPLSLCGMAVGQVFFQRFAVAVEVGRGAKELLYRTWAALFMVGVIPALLVLAAGPWLFSLVFGAAWRPAGEMASALAPMLLAILISSPTSTTFVVLGLQRLNLMFGVATLVYRPALLLFGWVSKDLVLAFMLWSACEVIQIVIYNLIAINTLNARLEKR